MIKVDCLLFNKFVYVPEEKLTHICSSQRGANKYNASVNLFLNVYGKSLEFHELLKTTYACTVLHIAICILGCRVFSLSRNVTINLHHHLHRMMRTMRHLSLLRVMGMQNSIILQACVWRSYTLTYNLFVEMSWRMMSQWLTKQSIAALRKYLFNSQEMAINETQYHASLNELRHHQTQFGHLTFLNDCFFSFLKNCGSYPFHFYLHIIWWNISVWYFWKSCKRYYHLPVVWLFPRDSQLNRLHLWSRNMQWDIK